MTAGNHQSRRALLQGALLTPIALAPGMTSTAATPAASLRDLTLLEPGLRYFNAANIGPAFRSVVAVQQQGTRDFQSNPSAEYRQQYPVLADALRARFARRMNVTAQEIALVRNASEANTVAVRGIALKPGDHVILTAHNHQSTLDTWKLRAEREGLALTILPVPVAARNAQEVTDAFAAAITPRTRAIFLSHLTNVTGLLYPVARIAALARAKNIWFHVDGAQTFGWMKLDLPALGCDSYSGSTHKWMMGPLEGGLLYVRRDRQAELHPLMLSHGYWLTDPRNLDTAQKYEILGQRDDPKLAAIDATLDALDRIGEAAIEQRTLTLADFTRARFARVAGAKLVGSPDPALRGPVIPLAFPGKDVPALRKHLWQTARLATSGQTADGQALIRFSPHIYNSEAEIDEVAEILGKL